MLAFGMPGSWEWILILVVALLIFGRRLPDVARSVGKSIVEFKKGIKDVEHDIDAQSTRIEPTQPHRLEKAGTPEPAQKAPPTVGSESAGQSAAKE